MTSNNTAEAGAVESSEATPAKSVDDHLIHELVGGLSRGPSAER